MRIRIIIVVVHLYALISASSCSKQFIDAESGFDTSVLIYMAANNNLRVNAIKNIIEMQKGFHDIHGGSLLVFVQLNSFESHLLKIKHSTENRIVSDTLYTYIGRKSTDASFLSEVIQDARYAAPAKNFGIVLWSHATSWLPDYRRLSTKSFGLDRDDEMDIKHLYDVLPNDLQFIAFDACFMGSLEVSYKFKDKANFILSSPSEILSTGFPYETITKELFRGERGLRNLAEGYISHYNTFSGNKASATITLVKTTDLDKLAYLTKYLITQSNQIGKRLALDNVQKLFFEYEEDVLSCYDFESLLIRNFPEADLTQIRQTLEEVVLYKGHTAQFFNKTIQSFSGLSIYYPTSTNHKLYRYYQSLQWSRDSDWSTLFY